jgi:integrase
MVRQEERQGRVHGPYPNRNHWRIVVVDQEGKRDHRYFPTEEEAKQVVRSLRRLFRKQAAKPLGKAMEEYELHMRENLGDKLTSAKTTAARLTQFFSGYKGTIEDLDEAECARRYEALRMHMTRRGVRIADTTQLNTLAQVKTFLNWCVKQGWAKANPAANVEPKGRYRHGKPQLRVDEARRWLATAVSIASEGETEREREGAVKALITLIMGLRECEVLGREVRDVDDNGHLLWIPCSKTPAGRRTLEVPDVLVPLLLRQVGNRSGTEPLFKHRTKGLARHWVQRICRRAGVMVVGAQSMRGLHATLAVRAGITSHAVASALGHTSFTTTARSYAKPEAVAGAKQAQVVAVLTGPKAANENDERPLDDEKLHNCLHNFSAFGGPKSKGRLAN